MWNLFNDNILALSWRCTAFLSFFLIQPIRRLPCLTIRSQYGLTNKLYHQLLPPLVKFWFCGFWAEILDVEAWPIRRHPGSTKQDSVCFIQWGGSKVIMSFCHILIFRSVGSDIGCWFSINQEAPWLDQSGGNICWRIGMLHSDYILFSDLVLELSGLRYWL